MRAVKDGEQRVSIEEHTGRGIDERTLSDVDDRNEEVELEYTCR